MDTKKLLKGLGTIALIIIICTLLSKHALHGETLIEYANQHPELAYASPVPSASSKPSVPPEPTASSKPSAALEPSAALKPSAAPEPSAALNVPSADSSFYYEPLSDELIARITGISYPVTESEQKTLSLDAVNVISDDTVPAVSYEELRYLKVLYYDFHGEVKEGDLICNAAIAEDLKEIFYTLYENKYPIEKIELIDEYGGDDTASMTDNNTSCFNYRVVDGSTSLSKHALGCAIDINPYYNPYVVFHKNGSDQTYISPAESEIYADRSQDFAYKIDENDLCYQLFKEHGFTWGGDWRSCKDYQHFQKTP